MYHEVAWTKDAITRFWDYYSSNPATGEIYFGRMYGMAVLRFLRRRIPIEGTIVDLGCGPGYFVEKLLKYGERHIAIESSERSIEIAKNRLINKSNNLRIEKGYIYKTPLADAEADTVFMLEVLEHLDPLVSERTFVELRRIVKPGGYLVVTVPNDEDLDAGKVACPECGCVFHRMQHQRRFTALSMSGMLDGEGFTPVLSRALNFDDFSGGRIERGVGLIRHWTRPIRTRKGKLRHLIAVGRRHGTEV